MSPSVPRLARPPYVELHLPFSPCRSPIANPGVESPRPRPFLYLLRDCEPYGFVGTFVSPRPVENVRRIPRSTTARIDVAARRDVNVPELSGAVGLLLFRPLLLRHDPFLAVTVVPRTMIAWRAVCFVRSFASPPLFEKPSSCFRARAPFSFPHHSFGCYS